MFLGRDSLPEVAPLHYSNILPQFLLILSCPFRSTHLYRDLTQSSASTGLLQTSKYELNLGGFAWVGFACCIVLFLSSFFFNYLFPICSIAVILDLGLYSGS